MWFPSRSDTNRLEQPQNKARSWNFPTEEEGSYNPCRETKGLISCAVTAQLICVFVFAYANCWFSYAVAHLCDLPHLLSLYTWFHYNNSNVIA